jgi:hypothetical protein
MITISRCNDIIDAHETKLSNARRSIDKIDKELDRTAALCMLNDALMAAVFHMEYIHAMIDVREKSANVKG